MNKSENIFTHDHFNTWQTCAMRYHFKYAKKLNYPDFTDDYELGRNLHALVDYQLRGFEVDNLLQHASDEAQDCWNHLKDYPLLGKKIIKTEWSFNSRIGIPKQKGFSDLGEPELIEDSVISENRITNAWLPAINGVQNWLIGRIDAIFYDSERNKYIIADWKTGKYVPKNIESNFQHKIYLYAFYKSQKDLGLEFEPEDLEFQYVKIMPEQNSDLGNPCEAGAPLANSFPELIENSVIHENSITNSCPTLYKNGISVNTIDFSKEKMLEYEKKFLWIIKNIQEKQDITPPESCHLESCVYNNLCFKQQKFF